ncbi:MAG: M14 family metallopeptidase [Elusimicrobiota bacterium]
MENGGGLSRRFIFGIGVLFLFSFLNVWAGPQRKTLKPLPRYWVVLPASTRAERSVIANFGVAIEEVTSTTVGGSCDYLTLSRLKQGNAKILQSWPIELLPKVFPPRDADYHDYGETAADLAALASANPDLASAYSAGPSLNGRSLWVLRINSEVKGNGASARPGVIFLGTHHAREHLSTEVPLLLAKHLVNQYAKDPKVKALLDSRDVYIIPMVNPDGVEYDIEQNDYRMWRKNVRDNGGGVLGVDLNRNYGYKWGTGGSSGNPGSEVYKGPAPFSEPETQAVKNFIESHPNIKMLLSFHTFSELILYPWGHTYDPVPDSRDRAVFEKMAKTMAAWNGYRPEQSSELYIASGDTTDWAYGERRIFAFTFELTPKSMSQGGFYPGAGVINGTFQANLEPCLYLISVAGDPYGVLR